LKNERCCVEDGVAVENVGKVVMVELVGGGNIMYRSVFFVYMPLNVFLISNLARGYIVDTEAEKSKM
jgi:hypothetical protein